MTTPPAYKADDGVLVLELYALPMERRLAP